MTRPTKITKVAIVEESESEKYDYETNVVCFECHIPCVSKDIKNVSDVVNSVLNALSARKKSEIKAWEEETVSCEHTKNLNQKPKSECNTNLSQCKNCELKENLWLCLICGNIGCGRQQFGGLGGNGHGMSHFDTTHHSIAVKLGTITPEGTADVFCYMCNEERIDENLGIHLSHFGIQIDLQQKTEKSIAELVCYLDFIQY